jgi:hypothetical protein
MIDETDNMNKLYIILFVNYIFLVTINISLRDDIIVLLYENKGIIKEDVF